MVEIRSGDEVDLLDSSIRTLAGALLVTVMYSVTGILYAVVTSPEAAGAYLFLVLTISLVIRPMKGVTRTFKKRGSEADSDATAYFGLAIIAGIGWVTLTGAVLLFFGPTINSFTPITEALILPSVFLIAVRVYRNIGASLLGAIGYPSYATLESSIQLTVRLSVILLLANQISTAADLVVVSTSVQAVFTTGLYGFARVLPSLPSRQEIGRAISFAKWSIPDQFVDQLSYTMPVYVLGIVSTPAAVAVYEAADRFADFGAALAFHLASPLLTKVSGDWSVGKRELEYLDSAVTGGMGATFVVVAYIAAGSQTLATLAFPSAVESFRITIILVGIINILRAFWTLLSFTLEAIDRPAASVRTKVYGLIISVPITAALGTQLGALAGAIGYITMNLVILGFVVWYGYQSFGRITVEWGLVARFIVAAIVAFAAAEVATFLTAAVTGALVAQVIASAIAGAVVYIASLSIISARARAAVLRALEIYIPIYSGRA